MIGKFNLARKNKINLALDFFSCSWYFIFTLDMSRCDMPRLNRKESKVMETLRKKYIPMTETIYYTLLSVKVPRHGYAIMQYVEELTKGRLILGTGTLYTMLGRLQTDGVIATHPLEGKKAYQLTEAGLKLLLEETERLGMQLGDGLSVLGGAQTIQNMEHSSISG